MDKRSKYIEIKIRTWNDIFSLNQSFLANYIFRGQGNEAWDLETSFRRMIVDYHTIAISPSLPNDYEKKMLDEFKWKYPSYQSNPNMMPKEEETIEWLSVMQHFGSKTRLLDFSDSMFVALYMALYGASNSDAAVWALNKSVIKSTFANDTKYMGKIVGEEDLDHIMYKEAEKWLNKPTYTSEELNYKRLYIVRPRICNERISRQQGLFVIPSNISIKFTEILKEFIDLDNLLESEIQMFSKVSDNTAFSDECGLLKIVIPNTLRYDFTRALQQMNITAETMYPGIEGLAQSVNCLRNFNYGNTEGCIINI